MAPGQPPRLEDDPLSSLRSELEELERQGLRRTLRAADGPAAPEMTVDGRPVINFCSNNYLNLAGHPALSAAASAAMTAEGTGAGAARLIGGSFRAHRELEARIATWKGTEAALLFGSGYQANLGLLTALAGPGDVVFSDALNHASLIDGARLGRAEVQVHPHNDLASLERQLGAARGARRRLIATESVFSMEGDVAPLGELAELAHQHAALLVVDEAHATGVLGTGGAGLAVGVGAAAQMGTLGKALGVAGAYVAGPRVVIDLLLQRARSFVFTTAPPIPMVAAAQAALEIAASAEGDRRRTELWARAAQLRVGLAALGLPVSSTTPGHIVPVVVRDSRRALDASSALFELGLFVQAIRPPTVPEGSARLRITVMAGHTPEHVDRLLAGITVLRSRGLVG